MSLQRLIAVNWRALVASLIAHFALGMAWYGVFANPWMDAIGKNMDQLSATVPQTVYVIPVITTIALTLFVAKLMDLARERGVAAGLKWALLLWACVTLPFAALHYAFAGNPPSLLLIDAGNELAGSILTGLILGTLGFHTSPATRRAASPAAA